MAHRRGDSSEPRLVHFTLTKLQLGLWVAGAAVLLAGAFSLGSLLSGQGAGEKTAGAGRTTVVKLEPATAPPAQAPAAPRDPQFYKELTTTDKPPEETSLAPIRLPDGKEPPKPPVRPAAKPEAPKTVAAPQEGGSAYSKDGPPRYTIQVLSVKEADRAQRVLRELLRKGVPAFIERADLGERGVWHRVRVGRFWDRNSAERTLQEIRRKAGRGGAIIPL